MIDLSAKIKKKIQEDCFEAFNNSIEKLSQDSLIEFLQSQICIEEDQLFDLILNKWIPNHCTNNNNNSKIDTKSAIEPLIPFIRFELMSAKYLTGVVDPLNIIPIQNLYSALKIISNPNLQNEIKDRSEGLLFNKCK